MQSHHYSSGEAADSYHKQSNMSPSRPRSKLRDGSCKVYQLRNKLKSTCRRVSEIFSDDDWQIDQSANDVEMGYEEPRHGSRNIKKGARPKDEQFPESKDILPDASFAPKFQGLP